jgi:hypothetical protein
MYYQTTMDATQTCDSLLNHLKTTNLNWNLVESPFSVTINVKKSFIKNKDGRSRTSRLKCQPDQNIGELLALRNENQSLREVIAKLKDENIYHIEDLKKTRVIEAEVISEKNQMISELDSKCKENEALKNKTLELNCEVSKLLEELEKGELEMNKKQVESKIANSNLEKLEKVITNLKVQKHEFIRISEAKVSELEEGIVAKDVKIDNLTKMQESVIVDHNQNSTKP